MLYFLQILILDAVFILIPVAANIARKKPVAASLGIKSNGLKKDILQGALVFATISAAALFAVFILSAFGLNDLAHVGAAFKATLAQTPLLLAYLAIVRPFSEEVFFRGFLTPFGGIWLQALLFAAFHAAYGSVVEVIGTFILGVLLGWYFIRNKSLMPNILAHWAYNLLSIWLMVA